MKAANHLDSSWCFSWPKESAVQWSGRVVMVISSWGFIINLLKSLLEQKIRSPFSPLRIKECFAAPIIRSRRLNSNAVILGFVLICQDSSREHLHSDPLFLQLWKIDKKLPRLTRSYIRCEVPYPWAKNKF